MAFLYESYTAVDSGGVPVLDDQWHAQTFTPSTSHIILEIDLKLYRIGSPGIATFGIYGTDGSGHPDTSGAALASGTTDVDTLTTNVAGEWRKITLGAGTELTASTKYAIVANTAPPSGHLRWAQDAADASYAGGNHETTANAGSTWATQSGADLGFKEYGGSVILADNPPIANVSYSKKLVVIGANEFWYESSAGTMSKLDAADGDFDVEKGIQIVEAYGKIFMANDSNLKVADFNNIKITTTDLGLHPPDHGSVLIGGTSGAQMVVDYITNLDDNEACVIYGKQITTADFQNEAVTGKDDDGNSISFTGTAQTSGPFWYDWTTYGNAAGTDTTYGELPNKATIACLYIGRVVISGDPENSHQWYMSRQGHPFDFLYGINDSQSAVAGNNADAGEIGDVITALIPYKDDYLIFGCVNTLWYLAGNPCDGGSINEFDLTTGIFGSQSWCFDGDGNLWFWGTNGLYKSTIPGKPVCISEVRLPDLVKDEAVDPSTHRILLSYDRRKAGIIITITALADGTNSNYFYDLRTEGFFPETYPEECGVYSSYYYESQDPDYRKLIVGCTDGYLRFFDESAKSDDIGDADEAIDSYVTFAPLPMSPNPSLTGKLTGLDITPAGGGTGGSQSDSDDLYFRVYAANIAEKIIELLSADTNPNIAGTIKAVQQRGNRIRRTVKGTYMGIKIGNNTAAETWAFEQFLYNIKNAGRLK